MPLTMTIDLPKAMVCNPAPRPLRICVVYSRLPFPMMRGDQLTVAHLISYLHARGHEIDFFTLDTGGEVSDNQRAWLESTCRELHIFPHGTLKILQGLGSALLTNYPFQIGYFRNANLLRSVDAAAKKGDYDIVYNYYLRSAPAVPTGFSPNCLGRLSGKPAAAFLALQLSQTLNTRRIYENESGKLKKLFYQIEWKRVRRYEARVWQRYTKTVLIGSRDVDDIKSACRFAGQHEINNWVLAAHGTDIEKFRVAQDGEVVPARVVFSGSMRYQPNVQAALWFVEQCWAAVRQRVPGAELYIVGQSPAASLRLLDGRNGIHVTGTVSDIGDFIRTATVCINPMLAAGGMQNKLIEYMACGKAVVATSVANEGICAPPNALKIADDAKTFTESTVKLLQDLVEVRKLGQAARDYVAKEWTWEHQFERLESAFYEALADCRVRK
jgi:glycosyltransferase involved in cell wall biosynthesis